MPGNSGNTRMTWWLYFLLGVAIGLSGLTFVLGSVKLKLNDSQCGAALTFPGTEACPHKSQTDR